MKRKIVTFYQENSVPIQMIDEDDRDLEEYSKSLTKFISNTNISIIRMTNSSLITRPSKITSIVVANDESPDEVLKIKPKRTKKVVKKDKQQVDIITDAD